MNFPQGEERLDERLDSLRSGLQSGALSPADARKQALGALEETVRECGEFEAELRAHTQVRLALMIPGPDELGAVPPQLRVNVRRALEREAARPARSPWRPIMNFAWTGGAMLSALGLFLIARPFLVERAQHPVSETGAASSSAAADAPTSKPKLGATATVPAKSPVVGSSADKTASKSKKPVAPAPPLRETAPATATAPATQSATIRQQPRPRTEVRTPSSRPKLDKDGGRLSRSSPSPDPETPRADSGAPPIKMMRKRPNVSAPAPAPMDAALLSVSGADLGFSARLVPAPAAPQTRTRIRTGGRGSAGFVQPPMVGSAAPSAPVQKPPVPVPNPNSADSNTAPSQEAPGKSTESQPTNPFSRSRPPEDGVKDNASSSAPAKSGIARAQNTPLPKDGLLLAVSVEHTVLNARIVGQIKGKGENVELWSGNAAAHKPISVPLAPLHPASGDTVQVAIEQKMAGGNPKPLATTSVVVP